MIFGELVRGGAGDGEIDESNDRQQPRASIVDRHIVGRAQILERENVDVSQQQVEGFRHEDRQRSGEPGLDLVALRAARHRIFEAAVEHNKLADGHRPGGDDGNDHRGHRAGRGAGQIGRAHQRGEGDLAPDVERHQCEVGPVIGLRDAGLHLHQAVDRNGDAGEIKRHHGKLVEVRRDCGHADGANRADGGGDAERQPAAARQESAQQVERLDPGIFRNETPRRRR